jgi:hypothetical protein
VFTATFLAIGVAGVVVGRGMVVEVMFGRGMVVEVMFGRGTVVGGVFLVELGG